MRTMRYTTEPSGNELTKIADLIDAGKIGPVVDRTFSLAEIAAAHHYFEDAHAKGKVVLVIG